MDSRAVHYSVIHHEMKLLFYVSGFLNKASLQGYSWSVFHEKIIFGGITHSADFALLVRHRASRAKCLTSSSFDVFSQAVGKNFLFILLLFICLCTTYIQPHGEFICN